MIRAAATDPAAKEKSRLDRVTLDSLPVGNDQYESQHNIQGVNTSTGTFGGYLS